MHIGTPIDISGYDDILASPGRGRNSVVSGRLPPTNAKVKHASGTETAYGELPAGTLMGLDSTDEYHPVGFMETADAMAGGDAIAPLGTTGHYGFFIGDGVRLYEPVDTVAIAITGEERNDVLTASSPHGLRAGDQVAISGLTGGTGAVAGTYQVSQIGGDYVIPVTGAEATELFTTAAAEAHGLVVGDQVTLTVTTGGAGAVTGEYMVATTPSATTFTLTGVAFTTDMSAGSITKHLDPDYAFKLTGFAFTTDISAGTLTINPAGVQYNDLSGARYITAVNRTTGATTISGAAITAPAGSILVKTGCYKPSGFLYKTTGTVHTFRDGQTENVKKSIPVIYEGDFRRSKVRGVSSLMETYLTGGPWVDPTNNALVRPYNAVILLRNFP